MLSNVSRLILEDHRLILKENLSDYLERIRQDDAVKLEELNEVTILDEVNMSKSFLADTKVQYAYNKETNQFYYYKQNIWKLIDEYQLTSDFIKFLRKNNVKYTKKRLDNYLSLLRYRCTINAIT